MFLKYYNSNSLTCSSGWGISSIKDIVSITPLLDISLFVFLSNLQKCKVMISEKIQKDKNKKNILY